jgi:endonuclease/exonuclease/phosphatase family metal-dependent hydrolase
MIANTHLDHSNDNIRKAQIEVLLNELSTDIQSYPVLLTGDFNSLRNSDPCKAIEKAGLNDGEKKAWVNDSDLDYTCHLYRGHGDTIDYCFYTKQWTPLYARIVSDDYGGYVSDHYGVIVDVVRFGS